MNLYELKENYLKVLDLIENGEEGLEDTLESINDTIELKADGYARIIRSLEANTTALKTEIDRLTDRKRSIENSIDRLKENLKQSMIATNKLKIKTDLFNITVCKNGGKQPIEFTGEVSTEYTKTVLQVDNEAIRQALESGKQLPFAVLQERGEHLRIK